MSSTKLKLLANGTFSSVFIGSTKDMVIKKIRNTDYYDDTYREINVFTLLSYSSNVVNMISYDLLTDINEPELHLTQYSMDLYKYYKSRDKFFSEGEFKHLAYQMIYGLHQLHSVGIIHGDIKPSNYLIKCHPSGGYPSVYIADFGLSYFDLTVGILPLPHSNIYTLWYRPPEVLEQWINPVIDCDNILLGPYATCQGDIWALACCLFELITMSVLFQVKTEKDLDEKIRVTFGGNSRITNEIIWRVLLVNNPYEWKLNRNLLDIMSRCLDSRYKCRPSTYDLLMDDYFKDECLALGYEVSSIASWYEIHINNMYYGSRIRFIIQPKYSPMVWGGIMDEMIKVATYLYELHEYKHRTSKINLVRTVFLALELFGIIPNMDDINKSILGCIILASTVCMPVTTFNMRKYLSIYDHIYNRRNVLSYMNEILNYTGNRVYFATELEFIMVAINDWKIITVMDNLSEVICAVMWYRYKIERFKYIAPNQRVICVLAYHFELKSPYFVGQCLVEYENIIKSLKCEYQIPREWYGIIPIY